MMIETDAVSIHLGHGEAVQLAVAINTIDPLSRAAMLLGQPGQYTLTFTPEES
jgi:hypothetical protein